MSSCVLTNVERSGLQGFFLKVDIQNEVINKNKSLPFPSPIKLRQTERTQGGKKVTTGE